LAGLASGYIKHDMNRLTISTILLPTTVAHPRYTMTNSFV